MKFIHDPWFTGAVVHSAMIDLTNSNQICIIREIEDCNIIHDLSTDLLGNRVYLLITRFLIII